MDLLSKEIVWKQSDPKPIVLGILSDIQYSGNHEEVALDSLKAYIAKCQSLGAYYLCLGDFCDLMSPSNRKRFSAAALYDTTIDSVDRMSLSLVHELYEHVLKDVRGRIAVYLQGHHFHTLRSGQTTDMEMCKLLDAKFSGTSAFLRLVLRAEGSTQKGNVTIFCHHGEGGGQKASAPLNKLENLAAHFDADIFVMAHTSKQAMAPLNRLVPRWSGHGAPDLVHRRVTLVGSGAWHKGYVPGAIQGSYIEQRMLGPVTLGAPIIYITPMIREETVNGKRHRQFDYTVSVEI